MRCKKDIALAVVQHCMLSVGQSVAGVTRVELTYLAFSALEQCPLCEQDAWINEYCELCAIAREVAAL